MGRYSRTPRSSVRLSDATEIRTTDAGCTPNRAGVYLNADLGKSRPRRRLAAEGRLHDRQGRKRYRMLTLASGTNLSRSYFLTSKTRPDSPPSFPSTKQDAETSIPVLPPHTGPLLLPRATQPARVLDVSTDRVLPPL